MPRMLLDLQNRGQLAAGFTTFNPDREQILDTYKQIGTVIEAFRLNHQAKYESIMERVSPAGPPSATSATPPAGPTTAAMPSRSSGSTAANGNGSRSPSTASWPTSPSCAPSC